MSDEKRYDNRTEEEVLADLEERRKDHVFQTTEDAQAWNAARVKKATSKNHWSYKANKIKHVIKMGAAWKRFSKLMYADVQTIKLRFEEMRQLIFFQETEITKLRRRMVYCNVCRAAPGEACAESCARNGSRDSL
jgi:hypothetical protein